ncbi:MAG TPA: peptidoglycan-associated lipoprotein Pal [Vicinamibacterales bacterium]|nr:peptidoglycan-associated lipoprotein Pal [Vicinamibacterales bacterium]
MKLKAQVVTMVAIVMMVSACAKKVAPVARPAPPPPMSTGGAVPPPPEPPRPGSEPVSAETVPEDPIGSKSLDDLNRDSPLKPVFYDSDSSDVNSSGQSILQENANVLRKYATWQITIEGHCDERGSAEYNLALGERRALAARDYLISLGIAATRLRTVSYGKEFPFDPAHDQSAWARNRRAHLVITAK